MRSGGVLHHTRVRRVGRVRAHPEDHPGGEAAGLQGEARLPTCAQHFQRH